MSVNKVFIDLGLDQLIDLTNSLIHDDSHRNKDGEDVVDDCLSPNRGDHAVFPDAEMTRKEMLKNILAKMESGKEVGNTLSSVEDLNILIKKNVKLKKKASHEVHASVSSIQVPLSTTSVDHHQSSLQAIKPSDLTSNSQTKSTTPLILSIINAPKNIKKKRITPQSQISSDISPSITDPHESHTSLPDSESFPMGINSTKELSGDGNDGAEDTFEFRLEALKNIIHKDTPQNLERLLESNDFRKSLQRFSYLEDVRLLLDDQALSPEQLKDDFLVEVLSIALIDTHQQLRNKQVLEMERERIETEILQIQDEENADELARRMRVARLADKTLQMRTKLQDEKQIKTIEFAEREAARTSRIRRLKMSKNAASLRAMSPSNEISSSIEEHQNRRREVWEKRERGIRERFTERLKKHILLCQAREEERRQLQQTRLEQRMSNSSRALREATDNEEQFKSKVEESLRLKEEKSEKVREKEKAAVQERIDMQRRREELYAFRARERNRLREEDLIFRQEVVEMQQSQLDDFARIRREVGFNRPNTVRDIYRERYTRKAPPLPTNTEGPTGYTLPTSNKGPVLRSKVLRDRIDVVDLQGISQMESSMLYKGLSLGFLSQESPPPSRIPSRQGSRLGMHDLSTGKPPTALTSLLLKDGSGNDGNDDKKKRLGSPQLQQQLSQPSPQLASPTPQPQVQPQPQPQSPMPSVQGPSGRRPSTTPVAMSRRRMSLKSEDPLTAIAFPKSFVSSKFEDRKMSEASLVVDASAVSTNHKGYKVKGSSQFPTLSSHGLSKSKSGSKGKLKRMPSGGDEDSQPGSDDSGVSVVLDRYFHRIPEKSSPARKDEKRGEKDDKFSANVTKYASAMSSMFGNIILKKKFAAVDEDLSKMMRHPIDQDTVSAERY